MSTLYVCCVLCMHVCVCMCPGGYKRHVLHVCCVFYMFCVWMYMCYLQGGTCVYVACVFCVCARRYVCSVHVVYVGGMHVGASVWCWLLSYIAFHFIFEMMSLTDSGVHQLGHAGIRSGYYNTGHFAWVLADQTPVLLLVWQALYQPSHLPSFSR